MRPLIIIISLVLLFCAQGVWAADAPAAPAGKTGTTPAEAELGKKTAEQIEKDIKLIKDDKTIAKLNAITAAIAQYTQRPDVVYHCKILDTSDINAMAIPGGTVYVTKGLLNAVESDDELAAVLGHEMAHNSLYHIKKSMEKEKTYTIAQVLAVISAAYVTDVANTNTDIAGMLMTSEMVKQAILNGYSVDLEAEADWNSIQYLYASKKYDPLGMYSVLLGFQQMENGHAKIEMGYLKNHPDTEARIAAAKKELAELHVPINLWRVVDFRARVIPPTAGEKGYTVQFGRDNVMVFTAADGAQNAEARANAVADALNRRLTAMDEEIQPFEIQSLLSPDGKTAQIRMRNTVVVTFVQADLDQANGETLYELANRVKQNMQTAMFHEKLRRSM
ncbi:MAG TPA: M48 family metalloprotease [Armatimonadota bacterium]|nr:M48 family metalloprotease [Armatimonadota bacterium]